MLHDVGMCIIMLLLSIVSYYTRRYPHHFVPKLLRRLCAGAARASFELPPRLAPRLKNKTQKFFSLRIVVYLINVSFQISTNPGLKKGYTF